MNLSPSRHPVFVAIACMSLFAAWSTPEAEITQDALRSPTLALGEALPPTVKTPASLEADCIAHAGSQRALCVYTATRQAVTSPPPVRMAAEASPRRRSIAKHAGAGNISANNRFDDRTTLDRSLLVR